MGQVNVEVARRIDVARAFYAKGMFGPADSELCRVLEQDPANHEAHLLFGVIHAKTKRYAGAETHLRAVLANEPACYDALIWLAISLKGQANFEEAIALCERAIEAKPDDVTGLNTLGLCWLSMREPARAVQTFQRAVALDPMSGPSYHNLGLALRLHEKTYDSCEAFKKAVELAPDVISNYIELYRQLQLLSSWNDAIKYLESGLERHRSSVPLMLALATAYGRVRNAEKAEAYFKKSLKFDPASSQAYGLWLQEEGRFEESVRYFTDSIRLAPVQGLAYFGLAEAKAFDSDGVSLIDQIKEIIEHPALTTKSRMYLCYALGKAYDQLKDFESAMRAYDEANAIAFRTFIEGRPFDSEVGQAYTDDIKEMYSRDILQDLRRHGSESEKPILIVGMIRSGTTLLDQIISSHPAVRSAGEQQFWKLEGDRINAKWHYEGQDPTDLDSISKDYLMVLDAVAGKSPRVTDKMPLNFEHLGLIYAAFPDARILHIRRNPLDTCLSIYTTHFSGGPNFAYKQENIVGYYLQYLRFMEHWRSVLPADRFFEVDYEDLVADREPILREVFSFLGLPWDEACLHHEDNPSAVNTPSRWQARQPVYSSSIERWRRYEPWLGGLLELRDVTHPTPMPQTRQARNK